MFTRIVQIAVLATLALSAFAVRPSPVRAATPNHAAVSPTRAVKTVLRSFSRAAPRNLACNTLQGKLAACPVTNRLRATIARELAWERKNTLGGNGNPFCRCQNPPRTITISHVALRGRTALVTTLLSWGAGIDMSLTFMVRQVAGGWLVDDSMCTGKSQSDLYHIPIGPCA
jgi:hypothetical protein